MAGFMCRVVVPWLRLHALPAMLPAPRALRCRLQVPLVTDPPGEIAPTPRTDEARLSGSASSGAMPRLELSPDEIHLWCAPHEDIRGPELEAAYGCLLSPSERTRQGRFRFDRDRHRFLVTRALVRTVLSRYASVRPEDWEFAANPHGRPHIANADAECTGLTFNVSHTDGLIVLGVARGMRLGVDVEFVSDRAGVLEIAPGFFTAQEVADLQGLPAGLRQQRFFEYWTLKEAYIKARGEGLSIPLDQFGFTLRGERGVALWTDPRLADTASAWRFQQFRLSPRHLLAVCSDKAANARIRTSIRTVVPLFSEQVLELRPTRCSQSIALP